MLVEVWSDVVCPWCAIGKARLEGAVAELPWRDEVEVRWRSYELDPHAPATIEGPYADRLAHKYRVSVDQADAMIQRVEDAARTEGIPMDHGIARPGNTFDAHRLLHLAHDHGRQQEVTDRFLRGYHTEGEAIGDHATLTRLAVEAGLPEDAVSDTLAGDAYAQAVRDDEAEAVELGCSGVPFFVIDRRFAISGAQDPMVLRQALEKARAGAESGHVRT